MSPKPQDEQSKSQSPIQLEVSWTNPGTSSHWAQPPGNLRHPKLGEGDRCLPHLAGLPGAPHWKVQDMGARQGRTSPGVVVEL